MQQFAVSQKTLFLRPQMKSLYHILILLGLVLASVSCAKVSMPVGGPKDTDPPELVSETPPSGNCDFSVKQIKITFNEFFTLNNPSANVLISPPLNQSPEYVVRDKSLIIKFKDTLRPNTTYNMLFSDCIQDYHEGNKLNFYHYSFSTGPQLDDYMLQGTLKNAQTLAGESGYFVMLYRGESDSLPLTTLPDYVTKSVADGTFLFSNITSGTYRVFALKDINSNLLYDLPEESIAFCETPMTAFPAPAKDTTGKIMGLDTLPKIEMRSFVVAPAQPTLMHYENPADGIYKFPYKSSFNSFSLAFPYRPVDCFQQINATMDTVTLYMKSFPVDTFTAILTADGQSDTILVKPLRAKVTRGASMTEPGLSVSAIDVGHFYKPMCLSFSYPVRPTDSFPVLVCGARDTQLVRCSVPDSFVLRLPVLNPGQKKCDVLIPDSVIWGYNGLPNEKIQIPVQGKTEKDYGKLIMSFMLPEDTVEYVAELWNGNTCVARHFLKTNSTVEYPALDPGNYRVSIYRDDNMNRRWDVGDYTQKRQSETIYWFPSEVAIRAFWDVEEVFDISK